MYAADYAFSPSSPVDTLHLLREVRRILVGDALHAHPYRLERIQPDRGLEYYLLLEHNRPIWKIEIRAGWRLPSAQQRIAEDLVRRGISHFDTWLIVGGALHRTAPIYRVPRLR